MKQDGTGTTWPDVGLAIVEFAREDTLPFLAVVVVMGIVLWFLFPRATRMLEKSYLSKLRKGGKNGDNMRAEEEADARHNGERDG